MSSQKIPASENIAYHATRLLILIGHCGKPRTKPSILPSIGGRTLLAKLDFFMRYPFYLKSASIKLGKTVTDDELGLSRSEDINTVESRMVRYLYGPWDSLYYVVIAYLIGKGLIQLEIRKNVDYFQLTSLGKDILNKIENDESFSDLITRADTVYHLFNSFNGSRLKSFIYEKFPEVVEHKIGEKI